MIGNPAVLKQVNLTRVLYHLRLFGPTSRADLSRITGLDAKTITNLCNALVADDLIVTQTAVVNGRGRPADRLALNPDVVFSIGVDIGSQQITAVLIDFAGNVKKKLRIEFPLPANRDSIKENVEQMVAEMIGFVPKSQRKKLIGIGICVPGFIDRSAGLVKNSVNIRGFKDVSIVGLVEKFGVPIVLDEASRMMALAELWFGKCKSTPNFACIDMGFGIGVGLVHNGMLYRGANECSGEIGHTVVEPNGTKCKCGKIGCLETVVSGHALQKCFSVIKTKGAQAGLYGGKALYESAINGNAQAHQVLENAGRYIGIAISNLINLYDPGLVILNGGLTRAGDMVLNPLQSVAKKNSIGSFDKFYKIEISEVGEIAGALGAAMLPMKSYFEFENLRL